MAASGVPGNTRGFTNTGLHGSRKIQLCRHAPMSPTHLFQTRLLSPTLPMPAVWEATGQGLRDIQETTPAWKYFRSAARTSHSDIAHGSPSSWTVLNSISETHGGATPEGQVSSSTPEGAAHLLPAPHLQSGGTDGSNFLRPSNTLSRNAAMKSDDVLKGLGERPPPLICLILRPAVRRRVKKGCTGKAVTMTHSLL